MKIVVLTNKGSIYGKKLINVLKKNNIKLYSVIVINQPFRYKFKLLISVSKRIGFINTLYLGFRRIFFEKSKFKYLINGHLIETDYKKLCHNIIYTKGTNSKKTEEILKKIHPDILVLGQTGILREKIINKSKYTINAHPGILPYYKGVDVHKWALINKDFDKIGCTVHLVDKGIDTGSILKTKRNNKLDFSNIYELIDLLYEDCSNCIIEVIFSILNNKLKIKKNSIDIGKQFYKMDFKNERKIKPSLKLYIETLKANHE